MPADSFADERFLAWAQETGFAELAEILLWRWDIDGIAADFPVDRAGYLGTAETTLYGLRAGDDDAAFKLRMRANTAHEADHPALADGVLDPLHAFVVAWAPRSFAEWARRTTLARLRTLPFHYHVVKYDPARSKAGFDDDGTWTSIADIGRTFDGVTLTREEYERVEAAHVTTILAMLDAADVDTLVPVIGAGEPVPRSAFERILVALLREGDLPPLYADADGRGYVAVGYDYHAYAGTDVDCAGIVEASRRLGLHVRDDDPPSPYLYDD